MEESAFSTPSFGLENKRNRSYKRPLFVLVLIATLGLILFGANRYLVSKEEKKQPVLSPTPTEIIFPTDTLKPTLSVSGTPTVTKANTPTPKPSLNPIDKKTGLDRTKLDIQVENGSGVVGAASKISDVLKDFGYHVVGVGNADKFDYENVTIDVKPEKLNYLGLLKTDLSSAYTIASSSSTLSASSSADALIIVGK